MIPVLPPSGNSIFDAAIRRVFEHEGYFSDHPNDPGGATQWGISLRFAKEIGLDVDQDGDVDVDDIRALTVEQAIAVYRERFWERHNYGQFGLTIGGRVFDFSVNMGPRQAHKIFQRALWSATGKQVLDDGIIGPMTRLAFSETEPKVLLPALRSEAAGYYRLLAATKPQFQQFLKGWLRRAYS